MKGSTMNYRKVLRFKIILCVFGFLVLGGLLGSKVVRRQRDEAMEVTETIAVTADADYRNSAETILPENIKEQVNSKEEEKNTENTTRTKRNYSTIRVLLTNVDGGYFFERVELELNGKIYTYEKKMIQKRGTVFIMSGNSENRLYLLSAKREDYVPSYRGGLILRCNQEGIYIVNELPLEEYLYQVVPSEMPASYPEEALKSQAILARTYGAAYIENPALEAYHADVDDTTSFQVYAKQEEKENTNRIVDDTRGLVLVNPDKNEELAQIYYFSTSCGVTTTTEAWNKKRNGMERSVCLNKDENGSYNALRSEEAFSEFINGTNEDDYEKDIPWYRWQYESSVSGKEIMERVKMRFEAQPTQILSRRKGEKSFKMEELYELGNLEDIRVTKRAAGGCVSEIQIEGSKADVRVRTEYSVRFVLCNPEAEVVLQDGNKRKMPTLLPSAFFSLSTSKEKKDVVGYRLIGGGFGHGIGMSQNGALRMAEEGMNCEQIVSFFYPSYQVVDLREMSEE